MTEILNGTVLARTIQEKVAQRVADLRQPPGLGVILVGENPASHLYVSLKEKAGQEIGIYVEKHLFPEDTKAEVVLEKIRELNKRTDINGILVQLPLPPHLNTDKIIEEIHPTKDVDGFHPENRKALLADEPLLVPPVALAIMRLIQATRQPLHGRTAVILGNSLIFAEPIIELLKENHVAAEWVSRETPGYKDICRVADIIVVAVGEARVLTKDMVKNSAIVIDVGTNKGEDGKVRGDASLELEGHAGFLSKVPGGVGPLTVAYLLMNVIKAKDVQERAKDV
ncbi:bifunctional 5,10-methylenetetrahydrofolate dehydrogenase/5,10-methenyltetrahydrofolate cyclohydrolase [bacterium]|nr:bifunctional 5,10-methylenetetrahydrofolate dehydrogenase/5,10-methenyltetrahydrofolate cyclohydrolase [bacterium]